MKLLYSFHAGVTALFLLNLFTAFSCIWIFSRMAPAIDQLNVRNAKSLSACEDMLSAVALSTPGANNTALREKFEEALNSAAGNITEPGEAEAVQSIREFYPKVFNRTFGVTEAEHKVVQAVGTLSRINRTAMLDAAEKANNLCSTGAWGVVFLTVALLTAGLVFRLMLRRKVIDPLVELHAVLTASRNGDRIRRCSGRADSGDIQELYDGVNRLLDESSRR